MSEEKTFWGLIDEHKIEIPVIQREYAQGRQVKKINQLREEFVSDLLKAIDKKDHFGFVYGKIRDKNKKAEIEQEQKVLEEILKALDDFSDPFLEIPKQIKKRNESEDEKENLSSVFIPLDGQQRLTTIFLLHWFLIAIQESSDEKRSQLKKLKRFSYKTRKSSKEFCEFICDLDCENLREKPVDKLLTNNLDFRNIWLRDSTVQGMLVTLGEIEKQFKENDLDSEKEDMLNKLLEKNNISFDFLDLNELNQTDDIYVKMNARGKELSDFEHFKAWLQKYVSQKQINIGENIGEREWETKLDKDWLDLFWKKKESFSVDETIYNAFKQITLFQYIATSDNPDESLVALIRDKKYVSFSKFKKTEFFNEKTLKFLFNSLNKLSSSPIKTYNDYLDEIACKPFIDGHISDFFLKNNNDVPLPKRVFYYAFLLFIIDGDSNGDFDKENFKNWMRVCRNLVFNTYIQGPKNFIDAIKSLHDLSKHKKDIYKYFLQSKDEISFFNQRQIKQEIVKIKLIKKSNSGWLKKITEFENHEYFNADIGFILEFAEKDQEYDFDDFVWYGERAAKLFDHTIRTHKERLLQRALLAKGDYLPMVGRNHTFCTSNADSLRARRDNWQRVLNNSKLNDFLKQLIDENLKDKEAIITGLNTCISNAEKDDWKRFAINCPETIDYCKGGFIRFEDNENIKLLSTSRIYGKHAELRSYNFYHTDFKDLRSIEPFKKSKYWENRQSQYDFPCIRLDQWTVGKQDFKLEITFKESYYYVQFLEEDSNEINNATIQNYFKENKWKQEGSTFFNKFKNQNKLLENLQELLPDLKI